MASRDYRLDEKNKSNLVRRHITYPREAGCTTCGGFDGYGGLFEYGITAVKQETWWIGQFCSIKCFDAREK